MSDRLDVLTLLIDRVIARVADQGGVLTHDTCTRAVTELINAGELAVDGDAVLLRADTSRGPFFMRLTPEPDERQRVLLPPSGANAPN